MGELFRRKFSTFNPATELPSNLESTCTLWLNKVIRATLSSIENECDTYAKQSSLARCQPHIHLSEIGSDLSASLSNGTILAVLLVFYTCDNYVDLSGKLGAAGLTIR